MKLYLIKIYQQKETMKITFKQLQNISWKQLVDCSKDLIIKPEGKEICIRNVVNVKKYLIPTMAG